MRFLGPLGRAEAITQKCDAGIRPRFDRIATNIKSGSMACAPIKARPALNRWLGPKCCRVVSLW